MSEIAKIGEELEVFESEGKFCFKLKGSHPPILRSLVIDRNIDIRLASGRKFSLIGGHPGLMVEMVEQPLTEFQKGDLLPPHSIGEGRSFRDHITPGVVFEIIS
jgi:hypothetical protein